MTIDRSGRGAVVGLNFDLRERLSVARSRVWGQFGPENKLIEGQPNEHDVICRNASVLACCIHTSDIARRQHLRSVGCHQLFVPRHQRSMFGRRAFSVAGPAAWNSLPDYLRDPSRVPLTFFAGT